MLATFVIIGLYLAFTLAVGVLSARREQQTPDAYFLADRGFGPVVLFFTLIATNFSAFFFLGFSGMGYRVGYGYYGMMAFGTALVGINFYLIGQPVSRLGRERGYITPPELFGGLMESEPLRLLVLVVMATFTLPYLAVQPIGAGYILSKLTGGAIPYFWGAALLTFCIVFYVFWGGMRSVAWTDVMQGVLMLALMFLAVALIASKLGGLSAANAKVYALQPELFSTAGKGGYFTPRKWSSLLLLWFFSVPLFPQVFMRLFTPRDTRSLQVSAMLYPLVTSTLFLCPIAIGVMGHLAHPGLTGKAADQILPMMLKTFAPAWVAALIMVGAMAAFMSTLDSQLLALSSMLTRDLYLPFLRREASMKEQVWAGRIFIVVLALVGLAIAARPPATIFAMLREAFTGLAVLWPATLAALYWKRATAAACVASILVGEGLWLGSFLGLMPRGWTLGFLPVLPILFASTAILILLSFEQPSPQAKASGNPRRDRV